IQTSKNKDPLKGLSKAMYLGLKPTHSPTWEPIFTVVIRNNYAYPVDP
ncbi:31537_t:CDS:1, partial [Gigaspora margarita]